ncbi:hypothetical protein PPIS_a3125 [Pseudoalteromonas piscicida]|uniref:Uncharacterized protein n=1 Tax=Pseudoalteromonas piscicida TaxID=43662 RepID=A0ABN5CGF0_PSEO7|nr:hypothetical protein PPIS_a3125 [Pseudoalteromonas piscicida]
MFTLETPTLSPLGYFVKNAIYLYISPLFVNLFTNFHLLNLFKLLTNNDF